MSTRNTVCCMGQGQAAAAALCAQNDLDSRQIPIDQLQTLLREHGVYLGEDT